MPSESDPLLPVSNGSSPSLNGHAKPTFKAHVIELIEARDEPTYLSSFRFFLFGSWLNILLIFVPLSVCSHFLGWDAGLRFAFSFIAIMPLAAVRARRSSQWLCLSRPMMINVTHSF